MRLQDIQDYGAAGCCVVALRFAEVRAQPAEWATVIELRTRLSWSVPCCASRVPRTVNIDSWQSFGRSTTAVPG